MSGTVPPPPPSYGGGREPRDVSELGEPVAGEDATQSGTPSLPPSIAPAHAPSAAPTIHAPIPPAPAEATAEAQWGIPDDAGPWATQPAPPAPSPAAAPTPARPASVPPPVPPRLSYRSEGAARPPASFQPTAQQYQQPTAQRYQQPPAPTAPQAPVQPEPADAGAQDWWGGQWSEAGQQPAPSYAPTPQAYAPAGQAYGQPQAYGQEYDQGYGQTQHLGYGGGDYGAQPPGYGATPVPPPPPPGGRDKRRRLTPGWIAFIAVDVLLIVVAIIFAVQIFGAPALRTNDADTGPGSKVSAEASPTPSEEGQEATDPGTPLARFASPSRNITCSIFAASVSCGIAELNQQPAPVDDCDGTTGYVVTISGADGNVSMPCTAASDQPKTAGKKLKVLKYGESITEGDFTCTSDKNGMQCKHDPSGNGFSLARAGIGTF